VVFPTELLNPIVSIVIPCYRQAHFLPESVESALSQTYKNTEVVVVNDGSDDETESLARGYGERIRYVSQKNAGLSSARNAGGRVAAGEYLLFLDADDLLHEEAVRWLIERLKGRTDTVAFMGWRRFDREPLKDDFPNQIPPPSVQPLPKLLHENLSPVHTFLCPRRAFIDIGMFEVSLKGLEDWDLWLRLALAGIEFATVPKLGAYYRRTAGSMITNREAIRRARVEILLRAHDDIVRRGLLGKFGKDLLELEHTLLRATLFCRRPDPGLPRLAKAVRELEACGFRGARSSWLRVLDAVFGYRAELVTLGWFRIFRKNRLAYYRSLNE
jgi:glycosyltransferase involved in cell wall biosynthesis